MELSPTAISQALDQLVNQPAGPVVERLPAAVDTGPGQAPPSLRRDSFSGSGQDLELTLKSGQKIKLDVRINQAGGISKLQLSSSRELSDHDQQRLQTFLTDLSDSVNQLFHSDKASVGLFDFANHSGVADLEFDLYQDDGYKKQRLQFEKEGSGLNKKIDAQLYIYDRVADVEDEHVMTLSSELQDKHQFSGSLNYQWLYRQVDQAISVVEDENSRQQMSGFFKSGLRALFETSNNGSALLQELGASLADTRRFIASGVKSLVADNLTLHPDQGEQLQLNGLASFNARFSSQRYQQGVAQAGNEFSFNMTMSQRNFIAYDAASDTRQDVQNRRLRVEYESAQRQAVMEYLWTRDESVRTVYRDNVLDSSHYRREEETQKQYIGLKPLSATNNISDNNSTRDDRYYKR